MIHDESDPVVDFSWFYFIGKTKLMLSFKETGRLTITMFNRLYGHYKDTWDFEMMLTRTGTTHKDAYVRSQKSEEWF